MNKKDIRTTLGVILIIAFALNYFGLWIPFIGGLLRQLANFAVLGTGIYLVIK